MLNNNNNSNNIMISLVLQDGVNICITDANKNILMKNSTLFDDIFQDKNLESNSNQYNINVINAELVYEFIMSWHNINIWNFNLKIFNLDYHLEMFKISLYLGSQYDLYTYAEYIRFEDLEKVLYLVNYGAETSSSYIELIVQLLLKYIDDFIKGNIKISPKLSKFISKYVYKHIVSNYYGIHYRLPDDNVIKHFIIIAILNPTLYDDDCTITFFKKFIINMNSNVSNIYLIEKYYVMYRERNIVNIGNILEFVSNFLIFTKKLSLLSNDKSIYYHIKMKYYIIKHIIAYETDINYLIVDIFAGDILPVLLNIYADIDYTFIILFNTTRRIIMTCINNYVISMW